MYIYIYDIQVCTYIYMIYMYIYMEREECDYLCEFVRGGGGQCVKEMMTQFYTFECGRTGI